MLGGVFAAYALQLMGFPDGHLTEVDQVDSSLLMVFVTTSAVTAVVSVFLGVTGSTNARVVAVGWAALGFLLVLLQLVAAGTLDSGGGG